MPLFQWPEPLFPEHVDKISYSPGDFPNAEAIHCNTCKLPVRHREEDMPLADRYIGAFRKVIENYLDLLG